MYKIDLLLKQERKLFHTKDLALLWRINNQNTLYTTVKRYVKKGILLPIHKGYYATSPIADMPPFLLAQGYLHTYAYLSTETVLIEKGVIFQQANYLTLISSVSKKFQIGNFSFLCRKLSAKYLLNPVGIVKEREVIKSTLERAVADTLYFNPHYYFDKRDLINWRLVKKYQKEVYQK